MSYGTLCKVLVLVACASLGAALISGCDKLGLGGSGGASGGAPPCNDVLIGPPVTPGVGGEGVGGYVGGVGGGGDVGGGGVGGGDTNPGDAVTQTCTDGSELGTYIRCRGLGPKACAAWCQSEGAYCVEHMTHPYNPSVGMGDLKQCMENLMSYTCTYCYSNGDVCTSICALKGCANAGCTNTGGKGCE